MLTADGVLFVHAQRISEILGEAGQCACHISHPLYEITVHFTSSGPSIVLNTACIFTIIPSWKACCFLWRVQEARNGVQVGCRKGSPLLGLTQQKFLVNIWVVVCRVHFRIVAYFLFFADVLLAIILNTMWLFIFAFQVFISVDLFLQPNLCSPK